MTAGDAIDAVSYSPYDHGVHDRSLAAPGAVPPWVEETPHYGTSAQMLELVAPLHLDGIARVRSNVCGFAALPATLVPR
jgi:hypothetical protein